MKIYKIHVRLISRKLEKWNFDKMKLAISIY